MLLQYIEYQCVIRVLSIVSEDTEKSNNFLCCLILQSQKPLPPELLAIAFGNHLYISVLSVNVATFPLLGKINPRFLHTLIFFCNFAS